MGYLEGAVAKVQGQLEPGEEVRAAARVTTKGANTGAAAFGLLGVLISQVATRGSRAKASQAGFPLAQRMAILVTDRRVLVYSQSGFAAKPRKLLGAVAPGSLRGARVEKGGIGTTRIGLGLGTGEELALDVVKKDDAEAFVAAVNALVGRPAA